MAALDSLAIKGYFKEVDFLNGCQEETGNFLPEESGLSGENYITETPIFFSGEEKVDFIGNVLTLFTLEKYRECILRGADLPKTKPARFYFYNSLAKSLAGSFVIGSAFLLNAKENPDWCAQISDQEKNNFCRNFMEKDNIKYLKDYYELSGLFRL